MRSAVEYTAIAPHGGELIDRRVPEGERTERLQRAEELPKVVLGARALSDLEMISTGVSGGPCPHAGSSRTGDAGSPITPSRVT